MKSYHIYCIIAAITVVIAAIAFALWIYSSAIKLPHLPTPTRSPLLTPSPIPRDVKILVSGNRYTFLNINGNMLEVIVFRALTDRQLETHNNHLCDCFEGLETLDKPFFDDFTEVSFGEHFISQRTNNFITNRLSMELSEEQLNDLWLRIDSVVLNYQEPQGSSATIGTAVINAIIDGDLYYGNHFWHPSFRASNPSESKILRDSDMSLILLMYFLDDLVPIQMGWEYHEQLMQWFMDNLDSQTNSN